MSAGDPGVCRLLRPAADTRPTPRRTHPAWGQVRTPKCCPEPGGRQAAGPWLGPWPPPWRVFSFQPHFPGVSDPPTESKSETIQSRLLLTKYKWVCYTKTTQNLFPSVKLQDFQADLLNFFFSCSKQKEPVGTVGQRDLWTQTPCEHCPVRPTRQQEKYTCRSPRERLFLAYVSIIWKTLCRSCLEAGESSRPGPPAGAQHWPPASGQQDKCRHRRCSRAGTSRRHLCGGCHSCSSWKPNVGGLQRPGHPQNTRVRHLDNNHYSTRSTPRLRATRSCEAQDSWRDILAAFCDYRTGKQGNYWGKKKKLKSWLNVR